MFPKPFATCATGSWLGKEDMGQPKFQCSFLSFSLSGVRREACLDPSYKALPIASVVPNLPWERHLAPERPLGSRQADVAEASSMVRGSASD